MKASWVMSFFNCVFETIEGIRTGMSYFRFLFYNRDFLSKRLLGDMGAHYNNELELEIGGALARLTAHSQILWGP